MKPSKTLMTILAVVAMGVGVRAAYAAFTGGSGSMCQPEYGGSPIQQTDKGAWNPSTNAQYYRCPLPLGTVSTSFVNHNSFVLYYRDRSTTEAFACNVIAAYVDGSAYISGTKYSCDTAGGCSAPVVSSMGANYIVWNQTELGASKTHSVTGNYTVSCWVPGSSAYGASYLNTYYAD